MAIFSSLASVSSGGKLDRQPWLERAEDDVVMLARAIAGVLLASEDLDETRMTGVLTLL